LLSSVGAYRVHAVRWPDEAGLAPPPRGQETQSVFYAVASSRF
jgi:hypothetical protein